jgi:hypothetical protein
LKSALKVLATLVLIPIILIGGLVFYWWVTYLDETITVGSGYGFTIGQPKQAAAEQFDSLNNKYPDLHVYVSYGRSAGDNFSIPATPQSYNELRPHDKWDLLLQGQWKFFDSIDLYFKGDELVKIYRHRQNFELP